MFERNSVDKLCWQNFFKIFCPYILYINNNFDIKQISKSEWIHERWPDVRQLQKFSLSAVFASFVIIVISMLAYFIPSATAYGWPEKNFFLELPETAKAVIVTITSIIFNLPVFVSCIFYFLLLKSVKRSPKIENLELGSDFAPPTAGQRNESVSAAGPVQNMIDESNQDREQEPIL